MPEKPASPGGSRYWLAGIAVTFGVLIGLSAFTFVYAEGFSYFSNDPNACMNCHIMREQFRSSMQARPRSTSGLWADAPTSC